MSSLDVDIVRIERLLIQLFNIGNAYIRRIVSLGDSCATSPQSQQNMSVNRFSEFC
jgi:hypothetical protein